MTTTTAPPGLAWPIASWTSSRKRARLGSPVSGSQYASCMICAWFAAMLWRIRSNDCDSSPISSWRCMPVIGVA